MELQITDTYDCRDCRATARLMLEIAINIPDAVINSRKCWKHWQEEDGGPSVVVSTPTHDIGINL